MIACCVLELIDDPSWPPLCAERYIDGNDAFGRGFVKHNSNSGYVDGVEHRQTPQAFSAHSFYASGGDIMVCDIQGVDDLYTDPQLHSVDESRGEGDLGRRGMALFFATCDSGANGLFPLLGRRRRGRHWVRVAAAPRRWRRRGRQWVRVVAAVPRRRRTSAGRTRPLSAQASRTSS